MSILRFLLDNQVETPSKKLDIYVEYKGKFWARNVNLEVDTVQIVFKAMKLHENSCGLQISEEKSSKN